MIDEEDIRWFVYFRRKGWTIAEIAEKLDRCVQTTQKIQREARRRGLVPERQLAQRREGR